MRCEKFPAVLRGPCRECDERRQGRVPFEPQQTSPHTGGQFNTIRDDPHGYHGPGSTFQQPQTNHGKTSRPTMTKRLAVNVWPVNLKAVVKVI